MSLHFYSFHDCGLKLFFCFLFRIVNLQNQTGRMGALILFRDHLAFYLFIYFFFFFVLFKCFLKLPCIWCERYLKYFGYFVNIDTIGLKTYWHPCLHENYFCLLIFRFTKDCTRFKDELDTMKFICKDFWNSVFKKQVDNLRTNHQVMMSHLSWIVRQTDLRKQLNLVKGNSHT